MQRFIGRGISVLSSPYTYSFSCHTPSSSSSSLPNHRVCSFTQQKQQQPLLYPHYSTYNETIYNNHNIKKSIYRHIFNDSNKTINQHHHHHHHYTPLFNTIKQLQQKILLSSSSSSTPDNNQKKVKSYERSGDNDDETEQIVDEDESSFFDIPTGILSLIGLTILTGAIYYNTKKEIYEDEDTESSSSPPAVGHIDVLLSPPPTSQEILSPLYLNPNEAIQELTNEPISIRETLFRIVKLGIIFTPSILTCPLLLIPGGDKLWWRLLLCSIEFSGTCLIKFGQWVSTRPDLFPLLLCEKFSLLHNQCPSHSFEFTKETIENNFQSELKDLFVYFEKEPMASGAVAQVHKAVISDGSVVVVKVLHPNVKYFIKTDFTIIYTALWAFSKIPGMKWLSLPESILEFGKSMMKQANLCQEASHLNTFIDNFKNNNEVVFPRPCYPLVSRDVLVETFEPGTPIMQYISTNSPYNPTLARIGLDAYMQMMLVDNFIHADLHPGNVLVRDSSIPVHHPYSPIYSNDKSDDNTAINQNNGYDLNPYRKLIQLHKIDLVERQKHLLPKLILLDVGLVTELEDQDKSHFKELFIEVVKGNGRAGAELIIKYAREAQCSEEEMYEFKERMGKIFNHVQSSKLSEVHVGHLLGEILSLVREYHVKLESNFATLVMGTIILEGLGKQLDPNLSLLKAAIPFLFHRQTSYILPEFFRFLIRPQSPTPSTSSSSNESNNNNNKNNNNNNTTTTEEYQSTEQSAVTVAGKP